MGNLHFLFFIFLLLSPHNFQNGETKPTSTRFVLNPYHWEYNKVFLPQSFSSITISVESNVNHNLQKLKKVKKGSLPVICLREGGPPLPDVNNDFTNLVFVPLSNVSFGAELCYPMQRTINLKLTNGQIMPGVWYIGFFNGIGRTRTQAKMIDRGKDYSFSLNINIEKCRSRELGGSNCDETITYLPPPKELSTNTSDSNRTKCLTHGEPKIFALDVKEIREQLTMEIENVKFNGTKSSLMCYARCGAIPSTNVHDFSANISDGPLVIPLPKVGLWFFLIYLVNTSTKSDGVCFSIDINVTNYKNITQISSHKALFPLEPYFIKNKSESSWAYFLLNVPPDASGRNLRIRLESGGSKLDFEVYARYRGLASLNRSDYFYVDSTSNSHGSSHFKLYNSSEKVVSFYILYVKEGKWSIGLRRLNPIGSVSKNQTMMLISIEECPIDCGPHGTCKSEKDLTHSLRYSYCSCDKNHGGFDCGVTIVSRLGHIWHSIFLIGSNTIALLPALWSFWHKAYAEWVVFISSGVSSAIYHACDAGNYCLLSYDVLQFMDFWLSFMAVVSTFLHLTNLGEASKRAIQIAAAFVTALVAINGATKASNIPIVIAIGACGLLLGLLFEFGTKFKSYSFSRELFCSAINRWQTVKIWLCDLVKKFIKRFRWGFIMAGFIFIAMAKFCWDYEAPENYWIWHSLWHISIYTSSFFFLCSKAIPADGHSSRQLVNPTEE